MKISKQLAKDLQWTAQRGVPKWEREYIITPTKARALLKALGIKEL